MSDRKVEPPAIVGLAPCGCMRSVVVDDPAHKRDTAKFVAQMVREGLRLETWTCEAVRTSTLKWGCESCDKTKRKRTTSELPATTQEKP